MTTRKLTKHEADLNEDYLYEAEHGNLEALKELIVKGAIACHVNCIGENALRKTIAYDQLHVAKYLLENYFFDKPDLIGDALCYALTPEAVMLLAKFNPNCTILSELKFAPRDDYIVNRKYTLLTAYDQSGLPRPPVSKRRLWLSKCCPDLYKWSLLNDIVVPKRSYDLLRTFDALNKSGNSVERKKFLRKIKNEALAYAKT